MFPQDILPISSLLFDLDGTLIDSRQDLVKAVNYTLDQLQFPCLPSSTIESYVGRGLSFLLKNAFQTSDSIILQKAIQIFNQFYETHCVDTTCPFPQTVEFLQAIQSQHILMAIVSNKPQRFTELILKKLNLHSFFQFALGPESVPFPKPHPSALLTALNQLQTSPILSLFIGDSPMDIQAAHAVPMKVGIIPHGFSSQEELKKYNPDFMVPHFKDFLPLIRYAPR